MMTDDTWVEEVGYAAYQEYWRPKLSFNDRNWRGDLTFVEVDGQVYECTGCTPDNPPWPVYAKLGDAGRRACSRVTRELLYVYRDGKMVPRDDFVAPPADAM